MATADSGRESLFDIAKGVCILAVVMIHTSGPSIRYAPPESMLQFWLTVWNRLLQFAVPAFLMLSAILMSRSLAKGPPDWRRYASRRLRMVVYPFVLWTLLYLGYRYHIGTLSTEQLADPRRWVSWFLFGKAHFHLYFLAVLIQLLIVLPFVVAALRRAPNLLLAFAAGMGLQLAVYALFQVVRPGAPASLILWYQPELFVGAWIGLRWTEFAEKLPSYALPAGVVALVGATLFLGESMKASDVNNLLLLVGIRLYATSLTIALLALSQSLARGRSPLQMLGLRSMAIYLVHPVAVVWLGDRARDFDSTWLFFPYLTVGALILAYAFAWIVDRVRLSPALFGR